MNTVCTLRYYLFKTVAKHWWIQMDWKHWINSFFSVQKTSICRTQWPDLSQLRIFSWHITYQVIFLKYLEILRLVTHRKRSFCHWLTNPCYRTLQRLHWLMLIKILLVQTSVRPKNRKFTHGSAQKVNIPKFSKLEPTKIIKSEFCGSCVVAGK
jgi:hypothetical protein